MSAVLELGAALARDWRTALPASRLERLRHRAPKDGPAKPAACRPLPPSSANAEVALGWARRTAAALGYAVVERELPPPKDRSAGFTVREHAVIFVNPITPGGAVYEDAQQLAAEVALTLMHELVHAVDPDEHAFGHTGEAADSRRCEVVAVLATEVLAHKVAAAEGCGGSQLRYLATLLPDGATPREAELAAIFARADTAIGILMDAARREPWIEPEAADLGHVLRLGQAEIALPCGPAAHGGTPPHGPASAAARWSRR